MLFSCLSHTDTHIHTHTHTHTHTGKHAHTNTQSLEVLQQGRLAAVSSRADSSVPKPKLTDLIRFEITCAYEE